MKQRLGYVESMSMMMYWILNKHKTIIYYIIHNTLTFIKLGLQGLHDTIINIIIINRSIYIGLSMSKKLKT